MRIGNQLIGVWRFLGVVEWAKETGWAACKVMRIRICVCSIDGGGGRVKVIEQDIGWYS